jgi:hypothetical protein
MRSIIGVVPTRRTRCRWFESNAKAVARCLAFGEYRTGPVQETVSVSTIKEDGASGDAPDHHVMHGAWGINTGTSRNEDIVAGSIPGVKMI